MTRELVSAIEAAREAMTNAVKHARATTISVFSEARDGDAIIHVRDNGTGFVDENQRERVRQRLGERVSGAEGEVTIESSDAGGTDIRISVPGPRV